MPNQKMRDYIVKTYFHDQLPKDFDDDYNLIDSGVMDSLAIINTVTHLEQHYRVEFGDGDIVPEHFSSVNALAAFVASRQQRSSTNLILPVIKPLPESRYESFPLNDIQHAYWLGRKKIFSMGNVAPHHYMELDCPQFDRERLELAWQRVIERHEMLRAVVLPDGTQRILPKVPEYRIELLDLSGTDVVTRRARLDEIRRTMSEHVFDVLQWPLFDIRITRIDADTIRLHFSLDIIVSDIWSMSVLDREWWTFYQKPDLELKPLTLTFRDYILAEQEWQKEAAWQNALNYWRNRLNSLPPAPQLSLARQPESIDKPRFHGRSFSLNTGERDVLQRKATKMGITPSIFLLTVFSDILGLWSRSRHFTLNLTLFNRLPVHEEVSQVVGDFTSLVLLEIDNREPISFIKRAKQVQEQLWQDLMHRYVSGVQIMRELAACNKDQQTTMPVVFTSVLGLDIEQGESVLQSLGEQVFSMGMTPQVWIDFVVMENTNGLTMYWNTVDELFPDGMLDDMFAACRQHIERLLRSDNSWEASSTLSLLPEDHRRLQKEVNITTVPLTDQFMHSLFVEQAERQPDHPAVISAGASHSYGELHSVALRLAHWLILRRTDRNRPVAVVMDKGWEQLVAVMGILYSGAPYVPIDPELPEQRLHLLLRETEAEIVLTQSRVEDTFRFPDTMQVLSVDRHELPPCDFFPDLPDRKLSDPAYIIFTSGSTGTPKGVITDHRGAVNTILDMNRRFQVTSQDRVLALSALNFDLSVYDIFGVLGAGGTVIMPDPARRRDPQHWAELMARHGVTLWNTVPALMQMLVEYQGGQQLDAPLRLVMMSGDWIPLNLPERIRELWPDAVLMSLGGATEASIWSICYPIKSVNPEWKSIPYGKPMDNQTFHVLNERLDPCPVRVPGQLFIGGIGLALGYWQDEEKTAAAFFTHPRTGERLYRTGDLGCLLPDGNIEFQGREDAQVKIRGHRIELGEIETCLSRCPDVKDAVVTVVGEEIREKQLAAYVVPQIAAADEQDYGTEDMKGDLTDPAERAEFKLGQRGLRQFDDLVEAISLPHTPPDRTAYLARQSYRHFQQESMSTEALSTLLAALQPMNFPEAPLPKYRYGSAGSLYPVQTYIWIKPDRVAGLAGGLYYYDPPDHRLVPFSGEAPVNENLHGGINRKIFMESAFSLFLISRMSAIEPMYGRMSRDFCLLEAGYMSQLLMEESHRHDIGLCPIGGMRFESIRPYFELNDDQELLHSFLGGVVSEEQKTTLPAPVDAGYSEFEEVRTFLSRQLPGYMVPNHYVVLDRLPLTSNGKVDRKSLPVPDLAVSAAAQIAPRTDTEKLLASAWSDILETKEFGIEDDFFHLGGNSILVIQLATQLNEKFQINIPLQSLFEHSTIITLAEYIDQLKTAQKMQSSSNMDDSAGEEGVL